MKEVEMDAFVDFRAGPFWLPRRDHMHLVPARGNALSNRLHEAAHGITREPWIRRRHHDDALAHRAEARTYQSLNDVSERSSSRWLPGAKMPAGMVTSYCPIRSGFHERMSVSRCVPFSETRTVCCAAFEGTAGSRRNVNAYDRASGRRILSVPPGLLANRIVTFPSTTRPDQPSTKNNRSRGPAAIVAAPPCVNCSLTRA